MTLFRWLGAGTVLYSAFCFAVFHLTRQGARIRAAELQPSWVVGAFFLVLGIGLLLNQRWAGGVFCVCGLVFSLWMIIGSLMEVPFPFVLINLAYGGLVLWASIAVLRQLLR
ncbi:hypothetical protein, partial [Paludibaculum fermentans]|uniref:hypothetical protein n=1 Tax=Paludibaculum fermentans TaxID=1473598 RepID=UPI003EB93715